MMRQCYQRGCLRYAKRKSGSDCWEFLWRETDATGKRVRRTAFIGTVDEYPTRELAQAAANGLRMRVNEDRNRELGRDIFVEDLVDHYRHAELCDEADWHALATKIVYRAFRHSYSTLLIANGENVKVVQELMRHANSRSTLEIYSQARIEHKRKAQRRLAEAIFRDEDEIYRYR
jgi:integrase